MLRIREGTVNMEQRQYDEMKKQQNLHWWYVARKEIVRDFAAHNQAFESDNVTILDVGCGMGVMLDALREHGEVFGTDMNEESVEYCRECQPEGISKDHIRVGYLPDQVPFENGSFDCIFALDVLEHVEDEAAAVQTIHDLLKSNGRLIITVPALMSLWSYNDELNHHFRRYDKKQLVAALKRAGFTVDKCSYYNSFLFLPAFLVRKIKNLLHIQESDIPDIDHDTLVNRLLKKIFAAEKYVLRKHSFPVGVSLIAAAHR